MNVYTCNFTGIYPVGACAVVVAETVSEARELLWNEFSDKLRDRNKKERLIFRPIGLKKADATILLNGDY